MRLPIRVRRALSWPLRSIPVTIRSGPNRGRKWSLPVSGRGIAAGTFEPEKFEALAALISDGDVVWDVGAHYGYASLLAERAVGPSGSVWSFEPSELNRWYLAAHLRWNRAGRATVVPCALADADGRERFGGTGSSIALKLGQGDEVVEVRSLESLVSEGIPFPTLMKIDVEGAEERALEGALPAIGTRPEGDWPIILCAVHSPERFTGCVELLRSAGYIVLASAPILQWRDAGARWRGDPDILAIPPGRSLDSFRTLPLFEAGTPA